MNISGLGCEYCALLLTHLCLAISLVSIRNAGERGMTFGLVYFRLCLAAVCLRGTSTFSRTKTA